MSKIIKKDQDGNDSSDLFKRNKKELEEILGKISIPKEQLAEITKKEGFKIIRDETLGILPLGKVIKAIIGINEKIDSELREKKKEILLAMVLQEASESSQKLQKLIEFISSPQGNVLYNKILRILDNEPVDFELLRHLASTLEKMIAEDFERLFEEYKYVLSEIERMPIQAMSILSDAKNWPLFELGGIIQARGQDIVSDWTPWFAAAFCKAKEIGDKKIQDRIMHSLNYLYKNGFMTCRKKNEQEKVYYCELTTAGKEIYSYLKHN